MIDCLRGDIASATDHDPAGMRTLEVRGVSGDEKCLKLLATLAAAKSGKDALETEILLPEKITTYVRTVVPPKGSDMSGVISPEGMKLRFAQVGSLVISGTDEWASRAIREAAQAREGSPPGSGGLLLTDLGPIPERPGIFGRVQIGTLMRQQASVARAKKSAAAASRDDATAGGTGGGQGAEAGRAAQASAAGRAGAAPERSAAAEAAAAAEEPEMSEELFLALEGDAGALPFAMSFHDGAATLELAMPLAMFEAFAAHSPKPARPAEEDDADDSDDDEGGD